MPLYDGGRLTAGGLRGQARRAQLLGVVVRPLPTGSPPYSSGCRRNTLIAASCSIGVNIQDAPAEAQAYLDEFAITYPNGADEDGIISVDYGVIGIPITFFINREGIVERRWAGVVREAQLRLWIDELAAGAAPVGDTQTEKPGRVRAAEVAPLLRQPFMCKLAVMRGVRVVPFKVNYHIEIRYRSAVTALAVVDKPRW